MTRRSTSDPQWTWYNRISSSAARAWIISGSPVWRFRDGQRHIVAVHNTGGPVFNGSVRLVKPVFDNLVGWKNQYT